MSPYPVTATTPPSSTPATISAAAPTMLQSVRQRFTETLSRARPKEIAHDYLERDAKVDSPLVADLVVEQWRKHHNTPTPSQPSASNANDLDARQQAAAERWAAGQQKRPAANS
jgi:hypothetical protein